MDVPSRTLVAGVGLHWTLGAAYRLRVTTSKHRNPFEHGGADYAQHRPTYPPELAAALAAHCAERTLALDVGCGSGQLTVRLAEHFSQVIGVDPSTEQIAHVVPHDAVTYRVAPAEQTGAADRTADLIVAAQAAHWFNLDAFYAEARRVARPGALLALVTYGVPVVDGSIGELFRTFYWDAMHAFWPAPRRHVESGYQTLPFPFAALTFPTFEIERDWSLDALCGYIDTWSATKAARRAGEYARVTDFITLATTQWGDPALTHRVSWPVSVRAAYLA